MEYKLIIDKEKDEALILTVHERNDVVDSIERLIGIETTLIGYRNYEKYPIKLNDVDAFYTDDGLIYVIINNQKFQVRERIYQLEEKLNEMFIKINQGCIVKISSIKKFEASISGSLRVVLKNGFSDYVSRRELKNVKRRLGL